MGYKLPFTTSNNKNLGIALKEFRIKLIAVGIKTINFSSYGSDVLYLVKVRDGDIYYPNSTYRKGLNKLIINQAKEPSYVSLLIIVGSLKAI